MKLEEGKIAAAYGRLIGLYPKRFRERFGESMLQTFRDFCREHRSRDGSLSIAFVLSSFAETAFGIARENSREFFNASMNKGVIRITVSILIGLAATAPFVAMEYVYSGGFPQGLPFAIFSVLWFEGTVFTYLAISLFRTPRTGTVTHWIVPVVFKSIGIIVVISSWTFIVADQMPCFLGGRGC